MGLLDGESFELAYPVIWIKDDIEKKLKNYHEWIVEEIKNQEENIFMSQMKLIDMYIRAENEEIPIKHKLKINKEEIKTFPFDGCDFCMDNIFINEYKKEFEMIVKEDTGYDFVMEINYCPKCGLKLK